MRYTPTVLGSLLLHSAPFPRGATPPSLSLTADDGRWVQTRDFLGRKHVVLLFLGGLDPSRHPVLAAWDEATSSRDDVVVFAVHHALRPSLAEARARAGVRFPYLFDPLAFEARRMRQAGRRPRVRDGVLALDPNGRVIVHVGALVGPDEVLAQLGGAAVEQRGLSWDDAQHLLDGEWLPLDVRTPSEFDSLHVPGAVNVPVEDLPQRHGELGRRAKVLCLCNTGERSAAAAAFLASAGYTDVSWVGAGMSGWPGARA